MTDHPTTVQFDSKRKGGDDSDGFVDPGVANGSMNRRRAIGRSVDTEGRSLEKEPSDEPVPWLKRSLQRETLSN
jgi:hypothetical protein